MREIRLLPAVWSDTFLHSRQDSEWTPFSFILLQASGSMRRLNGQCHFRQQGVKSYFWTLPPPVKLCRQKTRVAGKRQSKKTFYPDLLHCFLERVCFLKIIRTWIPCPDYCIPVQVEVVHSITDHSLKSSLKCHKSSLCISFTILFFFYCSTPKELFLRISLLFFLFCCLIFFSFHFWQECCLINKAYLLIYLPDYLLPPAQALSPSATVKIAYCYISALYQIKFSVGFCLRWRKLYFCQSTDGNQSSLDIIKSHTTAPTVHRHNNTMESCQVLREACITAWNDRIRNDAWNYRTITRSGNDRKPEMKKNNNLELAEAQPNYRMWIEVLLQTDEILHKFFSSFVHL